MSTENKLLRFIAFLPHNIVTLYKRTFRNFILFHLLSFIVQVTVTLSIPFFVGAWISLEYPESKKWVAGILSAAAVIWTVGYGLYTLDKGRAYEWNFEKLEYKK